MQFGRTHTTSEQRVAFLKVEERFLCLFPSQKMPLHADARYFPCSVFKMVLRGCAKNRAGDFGPRISEAKRWVDVNVHRFFFLETSCCWRT